MGAYGRHSNIQVSILEKMVNKELEIICARELHTFISVITPPLYCRKMGINITFPNNLATMWLAHW